MKRCLCDTQASIIQDINTIYNNNKHATCSPKLSQFMTQCSHWMYLGPCQTGRHPLLSLVEDLPTLLRHPVLQAFHLSLAPSTAQHSSQISQYNKTKNLWIAHLYSAAEINYGNICQTFVLLCFSFSVHMYIHKFIMRNTVKWSLNQRRGQSLARGG